MKAALILLGVGAAAAVVVSFLLRRSAGAVNTESGATVTVAGGAGGTGGAKSGTGVAGAAGVAGSAGFIRATNMSAGTVTLGSIA